MLTLYKRILLAKQVFVRFVEKTHKQMVVT